MRALITLLLCLFAGYAQAQDTDLLQRVMGELAHHPNVRADFTQQRESPALAQPQVSQGKLLFVTGHGMLWQVTQPYQETLALTGAHTARIDEHGQLQLLRNSDRGIAQVSQMLQSMLAGQPDEALRQFRVEAKGEAAAWTLRFTPQQQRVARVLHFIELGGNAYLQTIQVEMQNGESTHIHLNDTHDAGVLSPLESRALGTP